jgi:NADH-quinone oxidoreductase subunit C
MTREGSEATPEDPAAPTGPAAARRPSTPAVAAPKQDDNANSRVLAAGLTAEQAGDRLGGAGSLSGGGAFARVTVDVPADRWVDAVRIARDELDFDYFDWLSAVDELDDGFRVVLHLWSTSGRTGLLLRTTTARESPAVPSIVDIYPGAAWPERETHEMFGLDFPGHPGELLPLLLPPEFEGFPLRKEFVLASRVAKAWPGAKEPGEHGDTAGTRRAPMRPPGVPAPGEWGPDAGLG